MTWQLFISGILLGMISSFHCVGMCGPIALAIPIHNLTPAKKLAGILLYNAGRITTYTLLGLFFGFAGRQIYIGGLQQWFSVILGAAILAGLIFPLLTKRKIRIGFLNNAYLSVQQVIGKYIRRQRLYSLYVTGIANGLLPCGMVYFAVAVALTAGSLAGGSGFMASFGMGTVPLMVLLSYAGSLISLSARNTIKKMVPWLMGAMALLLILRGMNLGIPYLSPFWVNTVARTISCH